MKNAEAKDRRAVEKLWNEAIEAFRLYYHAEQKAAAEVSKLWGVSNKAMANYKKANAEITKKYAKGVTLDGIVV